MTSSPLFLAAIVCSALVAAPPVPAGDKNPADFPLRLHIFSRDEHTHYRHGVEEGSQGDGRANLFANGEVHAVDFHFECGQKVNASVGYETYMARWRKPGKQLTVLLPVFGKQDKFFTCDFDTDVKETAYLMHDGHLGEEPAADFKAWMVKHDYDPEHGKGTPAHVATGATPASAPAAPPQ